MRLPMEIIVMIGSQLDHATILSLSLTAKPVSEALETTLVLERAVRQKYRNVDIFSNFPRPFRYHRLQKQVIQDDRLAGYVVSLTCDEDIDIDGYGNGGLSAEQAKHRAESLPEFDDRTQELLSRKVDHMPWLTREQRAGILERTFSGPCESATLALLLGILVELRYIYPPQDWGNDVQEVVQNVVLGRWSGSLESVAKPLNKLQIFRGHTTNGVHGVDLEQALIWMQLPSLKRVILWRCRTDWFRRGIDPVGPLTKIPDVYLPDSCVTFEAIADFSRFIQGPCTVWQTFGDAGEYADLGPLTWDHCDITEERVPNGEGIEPLKMKACIELRYPASELHGHHAREDIPPVLESPTWQSIGIDGLGDLFDWTKTCL